MVAERSGRPWTVEEYLWLERNSLVKHEYARDRSTKFEEYRTIPTFREYVLAEPDRMVVHLYRRRDDGSWSLTTYEAADAVPLESLGVRLPVAALYHKVRLRPGGA